MGLKKLYLIAYNAASFAAWAALLFQVVAVASSEGTAAVGNKLEEFARLTQTGAVMEIIHALFGIVPAPFFTTATQVYSRLLLVWGISLPFQPLTTSPWYTSMLLAWSTTEVIRYGYFVLKLAGAMPYALHWLRYSTFTVLYPIGISSEVAMMVSALRGPAATLHQLYPAFLVANLVGYVPASFMLYTHMLSQRKKNLSGGGKAKGTKKVQ